ncbi:MAG: diacylglycerol kinase [Planctomycetia bacterium]
MWSSRRSWRHKFGDAFRGLRRAIRSQTSFAVHLWVAVTVVVAAGVLKVSLVEWCLLVGAIGFVLVAEVFNTAIESLARSLDVGRHPRIRDALDMASAAVLVSGITAALIGAIIFGMRAVAWLRAW